MIALLLLLFLAAPCMAQSGADAAAIHKLLADASSIGLSVGSAAPEFHLKDQSGRERNMASLAKANGLALVFFRSADW